MDLPFHPIAVHFPIALSILMPFLVLIFALMIKTGKMSSTAWLVIIGLQIFLTASGYVSLESGENEEDTVARIVDKTIIHEHEESAEIFVGATVITLVLSIATFFLKKEIQYLAQLAIVLLGLVNGYLAFKTGEQGGKIVYKYKAPNAYGPLEQNGLLPTPGMNTSESENPQNESLKQDENDYGSSEESDGEEENIEEDKEED
jgi:uncharacterized membrane protein